MRRSHAPDHHNALGIMQQGINSSIGGLTRVFMHQMADNAAARNDPVARNPNRILDLYKRRRLAIEAGRTAAIARYDKMIDQLEKEEHLGGKKEKEEEEAQE